MFSHYAVVTVLLFSLTIMPAVDPVMLAANDDAVAFEIFYRNGTIDYLEKDSASGAEYKYQTNSGPVPNPPLLNTLESTRRAGNRSFTADSPSTGYQFKQSATAGDAALSVFRSAANASPSAVVLMLRNPETAAGNAGATQTQISLVLPPKSVANAAMIFRRAVAPIMVVIEGQDFSGNDSSGFFEIARNDTMSPKTITVTGSLQVSSTTHYLTLANLAVGNDTYLVTGAFGAEPIAFAAGVVVSPL